MPLPWAGIPFTGPDWADPGPTWPWTLPRDGTSTSSPIPVAHHPHSKVFLPYVHCRSSLTRLCKEGWQCGFMFQNTPALGLMLGERNIGWWAVGCCWPCCTAVLGGCTEACCPPWPHWDQPLSCSRGTKEVPSSGSRTFMLGGCFCVNSVNSQWKQPPRRKGLGSNTVNLLVSVVPLWYLQETLIFRLSMFQEAFCSSACLWNLTELQSSRRKCCQSWRKSFQIFHHERKLSLFFKRLSVMPKVVQLPSVFQTCFKFIYVTVSEYCFIGCGENRCSMLSSLTVNCSILILN